jgi:hypothetical protein
MKQSVSVYLRENKYFVVTIHGSGGGEPCIASGPVAELPGTAGPAELGGAVLRGLDASTHDVPWPKDFKKVTEPLLAAAQVKTWATFAKRAASVRVDREGSSFSLLTGDNPPDQKRSVQAADAAALGSEIAVALASHSK